MVIKEPFVKNSSSVVTKGWLEGQEPPNSLKKATIEILLSDAIKCIRKIDALLSLANLNCIAVSER